MEFSRRDRPAAATAHASELIAELTGLVEQLDDPLAADLVCHDLACVVEGCGDTVLAADADEMIAQVITLRRAAAAGRSMPLAS